MTKNIRLECVHHLAKFSNKNIETGNQQILLPISAFLKLWSESTIEYCLGKVKITENRLIGNPSNWQI